MARDPSSCDWAPAYAGETILRWKSRAFPLKLSVSGGLAQLVERRPYKANVGGSIPSAPTTGKHNSGVVVQLVRIPACHAGGRGFESRPLRQTFRSCPQLSGVPRGRTRAVRPFR